MGTGQFCTNPGLVLALAGSDTEAFIDQSQQSSPQAHPARCFPLALKNR